MDLYLFNDVQSLNSISLGFKWINNNLRMTSAAFSPSGATIFDFMKMVYRNNKIDSTNKYRVFQCTGARGGESPGLVGSMTAKHVATYNFTLSSWTVLDSLVFDTMRVLGAGFAFVDFNNIEYRPFWKSSVVIYDANKPIISNLVLSEDTLDFAATVGQGNPPAQSFRITSDQDPLFFTLTEDASWLLKAPSSGTTPQDISVSITTTGLSSGIYFDSIRVAASGASNSPSFLFVRLNLNPALPRIGVDKTSFIFNALVGGANPAPQNLGIYNAGQSTLNWSVTNVESWLSLSPMSGTNSGTVVLTVTSSSLAFGQYYDTVVVTDPIAPNSPVRIPVRLSVASDLPFIVVDSCPNYWVVDWGAEGPMFTRKFRVRNGGPGPLTFRVEEHSDYILNVTPGTGAAPQEVELLFYFAFDPQHDPLVPDIIKDTVWVYSDDAANSPVMVECQMRFPAIPAELQLSTHSIQFDVYQCWQGYGQTLPSAAFTVTNIGDDDPVKIHLTYPNERFQIVDGTQSHVAPHTYQVNAVLPEVPTGIYHDTIYVTSQWAINNPQVIEVIYNFLPGEAPLVYVPGAPLKIPYQQDSGPLLYEGLQIYNFDPGCMNWEISENIPWLTPVVSSGSVPQVSPLLIDPGDRIYGEYHENLSILAPGASNQPFPVEMVLQVWKLRGDVNWNGRITVQDVALLLDYVFNQTHAPQPIPEIGDVDCDGFVNINDIVGLVDYLFRDLQPLCGNPY